MNKKNGQKKLLATFAIFAMVACAFALVSPVAAEDSTPVTDKAAEFGGIEYDTLAGAWTEALKATDGPVTVTLLKDSEGVGLSTTTNGGSNVILDLGGFTYTISEEPVGSEGTESQAMQLLKGNTFVIKNGTIASTVDSGVAMLIQNYSDLTLNGVTLDGSNLCDGYASNTTTLMDNYTLSNNCGKVDILGNTVIKADAVPAKGMKAYAFDVCASAGYDEGVQATVDLGSNGEIRGLVSVNGNNTTAGASTTLTIKAGNINTIEFTGSAGTSVYVMDGASAKVIIPAGETVTGAVSFNYVGNAKSDDVVKFTEFEAGVNEPITLSEGSVYIDGELVSGAVEITGDSEISGTISGNIEITIADGATLVVPEGETLVIASDVTITDNNTGSNVAKGIDVQGKATIAKDVVVGTGFIMTISEGATLSVAGDASKADITNNGTIAIIDEKADIPPSMAGSGSVDVSGVAAEGTISGTWNTTTTYTQNQTVTLTGDTTLVKGTQIVIKGKIVIPEGFTLTIEDGAQLIIFSSTGILENDGTILVQSNAGLNDYAEADARDKAQNPEVTTERDDSNPKWSKGSTNGKLLSGALIVCDAEIINNGEIVLDYSNLVTSGFAKNPQLNISGKFVNNGTITVGSESYIYIDSNVTFVNAAGASLYMGGKITDNSDGIQNAGEIVLDGYLASTVEIDITDADAIVDIVSLISLDINTVDLDGVVISNAMVVEKPVEGTTYRVNTASIDIKVLKDYTLGGLTIAGGFVLDPVASDNDAKYYDRFLFVSGEIYQSYSGLETAVENATPVTIALSGLNAINDNVTMGAGIVLAVETNATLIVDGTLDYAVNTSENDAISNKGTITVNGEVTTAAPINNNDNAGVVNAAYYKVTEKTIDTHYYTTLDKAVANGATKIDMLGSTTVSVDVDVPAGTTVTIAAELAAVNNVIPANVTITKNVKVSFASGAVLKNLGKIDVDGTLYLEVWKTALKPAVSEIESDVIIEGESDRTYTNLAYALANAESGDVIKLSKNSNGITIEGNVVIPEGVTLDTNEQDVTLKEKATLTVNGTLFINNSEIIFEDTDEDEIINDDNVAKIVLNGVIKSTDEIDLDVAGAYYSMTDKTTTYYLEPVANAAPKISTVDNQKMTLKGDAKGKLSFGDVTFTGVERGAIIVVDEDVEIVAGTITLDLAEIRLNDMSFKGTVANAAGSIVLDGAAVGPQSKGGLIIVSDKDGILSFKGVFTPSFDYEATIEDLEDVFEAYTGQFTIEGDVTMSEATIDFMIVDGNLTIADNNNVVEFMTVNGTATVEYDASMNADVIEVFGTLDIAEKDKQTGTLEVMILFVGVPMVDVVDVDRSELADLAAIATISGEFTVNDCAVVATGASVPADAFPEDEFDSVIFNVNGSPIYTVYAAADCAVTFDVFNANVEDAYFDGWYAGDKPMAGKGLIEAGVDSVEAKIITDVYKVQLIANEGIADVSIDGILMEYGLIKVNDNMIYGYVAIVDAGVHKIEYTLKNGYSGEATLTVNGEKVTGLSFTTEGTPEKKVGGNSSLGFDYEVYNLQLSGIEKSGYTPDAPEASGDDGMSLTEILLIVLVVLILIMAIIVAMRLMRS